MYAGPIFLTKNVIGVYNTNPLFGQLGSYYKKEVKSNAREMCHGDG